MSYKELEREKQKTEQILAETQATNEQLQQILQLDKQFKELSNSSVLGYDEEKKMFFAKDFVGVEIFNPNDDNIKPEYLDKVREVGEALKVILHKLHEENPRFSYQLVIEGTAAIKWDQKAAGTYNPDNQEMYWLSYRRALALYNKWRSQGLNLRNYNTEIIIAGSGFNGINRDNRVEDNNKRFIIQIIPKVSRPNPEITNPSEYVRVSETNKLKIYYPQYSKIDLICGEIPKKSDENVIMTCAAAYTVKCEDSFSHSNIIGDHVSNGSRFSGAPSKTYRGAFAFYDGAPHFAYNNWNNEFKEASSKGGCGFAQDMMIHNGKITDYWRDNASSTEFRALCQIGGKIAIVDSKGIQKFGDFVDELSKLGVTEAIYLDMGNWKHSWYRDSNGMAVDIYPNPNKYATNWITFYK